MGIVQPTGTNKEITTLLGEVQSQIEALRLEKEQKESHRWQTQYLPPRNKTASQSNKCNYCQRPGHFARECRSRLAGIICHNCGQKGHEQRNCRNNRGFSQPRQQVKWQSQDARNTNQNWRSNRNNERQYNLAEVEEIIQQTIQAEQNLKD